MPAHRVTTRYALLLGLITILFVLRVSGQALVAMLDIPFLPPMHEWYSGVIPYAVLLPIQLLMIAVMAKIMWDFARGVGTFVQPRAGAGPVLKWFSYLYAGAMGLRYVLTMALYPERRWLGGTIPIGFHLALAAFVYTLAHYHLHHAGPPVRR